MHYQRMIEPALSLVVSVYYNKGVYALLLGSGGGDRSYRCDAVVCGCSGLAFYGAIFFFLELRQAQARY